MNEKIYKIAKKIISDVQVKDYNSFLKYIEEHPEARPTTKFVTPNGQTFYKRDVEKSDNNEVNKNSDTPISLEYNEQQVKSFGEAIKSYLEEDEVYRNFDKSDIKHNYTIRNYVAYKMLNLLKLDKNVQNRNGVIPTSTYNNYQKDEIKNAYNNILSCFSDKYVADASKLTISNIFDSFKGYIGYEGHTDFHVMNWANIALKACKKGLNVGKTSSRAKYSPLDNKLNTYIYRDSLEKKEKVDISTLIHEMGHFLEATNPDIRKKTQDFLAKRTVGELPVQLRKLFPKRGYKKHEICKKDDFIDAYVGKIYRDDSTEVLSMGLEYMFTDSVGFAEKDPEMFHFIFNIMNGNAVSETTKTENKKSYEDLTTDEKIFMINFNNPTEELLIKASQDKDEKVKKAILELKKLPDKVWEILSKDEEFDIRYSVAEHKNAPVKVLKFLSNDDSSAVREMVALNPKSTKEILSSLVDDKEYYVRLGVSQNPNTAGEDLEKLLDNYENDVYYDSDENNIFNNVSSHKNVTQKALEKLAKHKSANIRKNVASRIESIEVLKELSNDEDYMVRGMVAKNAITTPEILSKLSKDKEGFVKYWVSHNIKTPIEDLEQLSNDKNGLVSEVAKKTLSKKPKQTEVKETKSTIKNLFKSKEAEDIFDNYLKSENEDDDNYLKSEMFKYNKLLESEKSKGFGRGGNGEPKRTPEQVRIDFINHLDRNNYSSIEAFNNAKQKLSSMSINDFMIILKSIMQEEEEEIEL